MWPEVAQSAQGTPRSDENLPKPSRTMCSINDACPFGSIFAQSLFPFRRYFCFSLCVARSFK